MHVNVTKKTKTKMQICPVIVFKYQLLTLLVLVLTSVSRSIFMKIQGHSRKFKGKGYAVGEIVARIDAVHGINSIPAWDG